MKLPSRFVLSTLLACLTATAHDLQESRAQLVLRDPTHISVTLYLNYPEILRQVLSPGRDLASFLVMYSAMKPEDLRQQLLKAQSRLQADTHILAKSGPGSPPRELTLGNWIWPDQREVQAMFQQLVVQSVVGDHLHLSPAEIHADANGPLPISSVTVILPEQFQKVLVVSYRPRQVWVGRDLPNPDIRF